MQASTEQELSEGSSLLTVRFQILDRLGDGGMGVVYEALDRQRGFRVALKTLKSLSSERALFLKREFRIAAGLRHKNLVKLYDLFATPSQCFFTMELVKGGVDLVSFVRGTGGKIRNPILEEFSKDPNIQTTRRLREVDQEATTPFISSLDKRSLYHQKRLLEVLSQLCFALDTIHQEGLVHRDLKPDNILVTRGGDVKILDFGIAQSKGIGQEVSNRRIARTGTPFYMSPEQAQEQTLTPFSDFYSVGVILFEILTGQLPFQGETLPEILLQHVSKEPPSPSDLASGIPPALEQLCLQLLDKNPSNRPTARTMAKCLESLGAPLQTFSKPKPRRFVGREIELSQIETLAEEAKNGACLAALVKGESGSGKTTLCAEFAHRLLEDKWRLVASRCYEREFLPYNALDPLVDTISSSLREQKKLQKFLPKDIGILAKMFPSLQGLSSTGVTLSDMGLNAKESRQRAIQALQEILNLFRGSQPLALWIEDLQWADLDSVKLLSTLLQSETLKPFFLFGSFRGVELRQEHPLATLLSQENTNTISLSPFGEIEIAALLGDWAEKKQITRIAKETRGNAFFAVAMSQALVEGEPAGDLSSFLRSRIDALNVRGRRILEWLAVSNATTTFAALREATGLPSATLAEALDFLQSRRWISTADDPLGEEELYELYHNRIRETVYSSLSLENRRRMHQSLAKVLIEQNANAENISNHYLASEQQKLAAPWLFDAGHQAAKQLASARAVKLYQRAIEAGGPDWTDAQAAREARADVLDRAGGQYKEAALAFREAAEHTKGFPSVRLLLSAAEADVKQGKIEDALEAGAKALAPYERLRFPSGIIGSLFATGWHILRAEWKLLWLRKLPGRIGTEVHSAKHYLYHRFSVVLACFDLLRSFVLSSRSMSLALSKGTDEDVVDALALYSIFIGMRRGKKNLQRAQKLFTRCLTWQYAAKDPEIVNWIQEAHGMMKVLAGDFAAARKIFPEVLKEYHNLGRLAGVEIVTNLSYQANAESSLGNPNAGWRYLANSLKQAIDEKDKFFLRGVIPTAVHLKTLLGDLSSAETLAREVSLEGRNTSNPTTMPLAYYEAALFLAQKKFTKAREAIDTFLQKPLEHGIVVFGEPKIRSYLLLALIHLAEFQNVSGLNYRLEALKKARRAVKKTLSCDDPVLSGICFRVAGLVEVAYARRKQAHFWLNRAVKALEQKGEQIELSAALLARGALTGNIDDTRRGKTLFEQGSFLDPAVREGNAWIWK